MARARNYEKIIPPYVVIQSLHHKINRKAMIVSSVREIEKQFYAELVADAVSEEMETEYILTSRDLWDAFEETLKAKVGDKVARYL